VRFRIQSLIILVFAICTIGGCAAPTLQTHFPAYGHDGFTSNFLGVGAPNDMHSWFFGSPIILTPLESGKRGIWVFVDDAGQSIALLPASDASGRYSTAEGTLYAWLLRKGFQAGDHPKEGEKGGFATAVDLLNHNDLAQSLEAIPLFGTLEFKIASDAASMPDSGKIDTMSLMLSTVANIPPDKRYYTARIELERSLLQLEAPSYVEQSKKDIAEYERLLQLAPSAPAKIEATFYRIWISKTPRPWL